MPGINGRDTIGGGPLVGMLRRFEERSARIQRARCNVLNRVTHAVPHVAWSMLIAGIGRLRHQNPHLSRSARSACNCNVTVPPGAFFRAPEGKTFHSPFGPPSKSS